MDESSLKKLIEDVSYLRGRFDTAIPQMEKASENINSILIMHKEKIERLESEQTAIKTKVAIFGSIAGVLGGALISILVAIVKNYIPGAH